MNYALLADLMAGLHVAYVAVVVFGLLLILVGKALGWKWVGNRWFRVIHLSMIVGVVIRAAIWKDCPLTWWEEDLRALAVEQGTKGSSLGLFLHDLIHPSAQVVPLWIYPIVYVAFAALVVAAFWLVPVNWKPRRDPPPHAAQTA
jgi:predicted Na+-dependent transporter